MVERRYQYVLLCDQCGVLGAIENNPEWLKEADAHEEQNLGHLVEITLGRI